MLLNTGSLRRVAVRGVTVLFAANVAAKLAGFATIYVTGVMLTKNDFAVYAIAVAWGEIFGFLQNGGLHRFLIQRGKSFDSLYRPVLGLSFIFNLFWCFALVALAPVLSHIYDTKTLVVLLILYGISFPARTIALLLRSYLLVNLRFSEISTLDVYSAVLRNGGVIILAILGFGPLSFVFPVIWVGIFESIFLCLKRKKSWRPSFPRRKLLRAIMLRTGWIMLSMLAASFVLNGDYMIVGALSDKITVGVYFFGFQLTVAVLTMFVQSLRSVYISSFVTLSHHPERQREAFLLALEMGSGLLFFIMFGVAAIAEPTISLVWSGKWDAAIIVVEIIAVASLSRVVSPIGRALFEAQGNWRTLAAMLWIEGLGLMVSAGIGAVMGGVEVIVSAVAIYMIVFGILYLFVLSRQTKSSFAMILWPILGIYAIAATSLLAAWNLAPILSVSHEAYLQILIRGSLFTVCFMSLSLLFRRAMFMTALDGMRHLIVR
jgi:O-antigen/teichoic acid export membrane protein